MRVERTVRAALAQPDHRYRILLAGEPPYCGSGSIEAVMEPAQRAMSESLP